MSSLKLSYGRIKYFFSWSLSSCYGGARKRENNERVGVRDLSLGGRLEGHVHCDSVLEAFPGTIQVLLL